MSTPQHPEATEIYAPAPRAQSTGTGRARPDLEDPAAVAELAARIGSAEGWRGTHAVTLLSVEEIKAIARFAWASSFVVTASMGFEQAAIDGDALREADMRAELAAAHDAFMALFLPPGAHGTISAPDAAPPEGEDAT